MSIGTNNESFCHSNSHSSQFTQTVFLILFKSRENLHKGVLRDIERQKHRHENTIKLQQQIELTKQLRETQKNAGVSVATE